MTTQEADNVAELWKNQAAGMRWVKRTDRQGKESGKTVQPGKTFTITPFDRQNNQDSVATPQQDLFRNGTFVLVKAGKDTNMDEIESPDSLTDLEVRGIVHDILAKNTTADRAIRDINSPVALGRLYTRMMTEEDIPKHVLDVVKTKKVKMEGGTQVATERVAVSAAPEPDVVNTPRDGIPEVETPSFVKTEPEKVG